jgi:hypothetical protein
MVLTAIPLWSALLTWIAFPETRWGPEGTSLIAELCRLMAYAIIVAGGAFLIAYFARTSALRHAFIASIGAIAAFVVPYLVYGLPLSGLATFYREAIFFVGLFPILTLAWSRTSWLTAASSATLVGRRPSAP